MRIAQAKPLFGFKLHLLVDVRHEVALSYQITDPKAGDGETLLCNAGKPCGRTVRVPRSIDLRRFPPIPRATKKFERLYKGRTAVERVNGRLKVFWGADDGNITGSRRFHARAGTVMIVHAAFATLLAATPRRDGTLDKMNLSPLAQALRDKFVA